MSKRRVRLFDVETDGFYFDATKIHCLVVKDPETGRVCSASSQPDPQYRPLDEAIAFLLEGDIIVGHNVVSFDLPVLRKLNAEVAKRPVTDGPKGLVRDTILLTRLFYADVRTRDIKRKGFPGKHIGSHALEAWGHRLGVLKGEYSDWFKERAGASYSPGDEWKDWCPEMQAYCEQDVEVTHKLWDRCLKTAEEWGIDMFDYAPDPNVSCIQLEHDVARIVSRQEKFGFPFDVLAAQKLAGELFGWRSDLEAKIQQAFPPKLVEEIKVPKVNSKAKGWVKGVPITVRKHVAFNPGSRQQVGSRLREMGWEPSEFTADGHPKISDETLAEAARIVKEADILADYFLNGKRLGMLATGDSAWLAVQRNGRIHGGVITNGAVTGRMTHASPNVAQVPGIKSKKLIQRKDPFQARYRALFMAPSGMVLVGCDADALELRDLAGYMAIYDGGAYIRTVLEGKKEDGTDMHTLNAKALGCDRETAKIWFYAFIYGAGDFKLGMILGVRGSYQEVAGAGKRSRAKFLKALPALGRLTERVQQRVKRGYVVGLDGRRISIRAEHAALNSLLQGAGAIQMKVALVILDRALREERGLIPGEDYEFVANIHDEWQIACKPDIADRVGALAAESIAASGRSLGFRCPLAGNYSVGNTWADTH